MSSPEIRGGEGGHGVTAPGLPEASIRARARHGVTAVFPDAGEYGSTLFGAGCDPLDPLDVLDRMRIVPPVFVPDRMEKLYELGREPMYGDVDLSAVIGGFRAPAPVFVCAFGSTRAGNLGLAAAAQAGRLGLPMVIGENLVPMRGYGGHSGLLERIRAYAEAADDDDGGVVVQQSTEDADAEVWNLVYSDPFATRLLDSGRLAFELKVGQGAKPGLGGMTLLSGEAAAAVRRRYTVDDAIGGGNVLRSSSPGTFTEEILRHQVRLMRNNYPRARVWVKLHPGRDVAGAAEVAWAAGADTVTVDGAEGGTGWAPPVFLGHVGLPLGECLRRLAPLRGTGGLTVSGRIWEGGRTLKCLALGAAAVGLGRAALLAVDEDPDAGLERLVRCLELELRLLTSALGRYRVADLSPQDLWPALDPQKGTHDDRHTVPDADPLADPVAHLQRDRAQR